MIQRPLLLVASLLLAACNPFDTGYNADRTPRMTPNAKIDRLFTQTKPVCFGRFLIDVPATAEVVWGPTRVHFEIDSYPGQGMKIPAEIYDKEQVLKEEKHIEEPSSYIGTFDGPNPQSKIVIGYATFESSGRIQLHSYIRLGQHAFVQSVGSAPLGELPDGSDDKASYTRWLNPMQDVAGRLRFREESEIPAEPGICIDSGFVSESESRYHEMTSIGFRFPEYPDVSFSIRTTKTDRPNEANSMDSMQKNAEEEAKLYGKSGWFDSLKQLRKGKRQMGDWEGGELLMRAPSEESGGPTTHEFMFRSIGVANDPLRPKIDMRLSTGVDGNDKGVNEPSLKDDEVIALWDKLSVTIRARPVKAGNGASDDPAAPTDTSPAKPAPQAALPATPLGATFPTGVRCPQSGFWQCAAAEAFGGDRRYLAAGWTLPSVLVPVPRSLFQKLARAPSKRLADTTWTLIAYPDPTEKS